MSKDSAKNLILKLIEELNDYVYRYYVLSQPIISDVQYDQKFRELQKLESAYPQFVLPESPTQRVGAQPLTGFSTIKHRVPMLSLDNAMNSQELIEFDDRVRRFLEKEVSHNLQVEYTVEHKFDGVATSLIYEDGVLVKAATRGDGEVGEDITQNVKTIKSVPLKFRRPLKGIFEVRGETMFLSADFERFNSERVKAGEEPFANPRNAASGTLRQLDPQVTASRPLSFLSRFQSGIKNQSHDSSSERLCRY